ncbi:MAG: hypothetical protein U0360_08650 [Dehalococcoidia bacterium]
MDALTALGVVSTGAAILFYHLEPRHSGWVLAFAVASLSSAVYAFLQGAWPFGVAELFWVGVSSHRYWLLSTHHESAYVPGVLPVVLAPAEPSMLEVPRHCRAGYPLRLLSALPSRSEPRELPTAAIG